MDCVCELCIQCCKRAPGWFAPEEAEKVAAYLRLDFDLFVKTYLIKDYWVGGPFVWSPRKVGVDTDRDIAMWSAAWSEAPCVFLTDKDRCMIHPVKPYECRESFACSLKRRDLREEIAELWKKAGYPLGRESYLEKGGMT